jgi:hypothetical protein
MSLRWRPAAANITGFSRGRYQPDLLLALMNQMGTSGDPDISFRGLAPPAHRAKTNRLGPRAGHRAGRIVRRPLADVVS